MKKTYVIFMMMVTTTIAYAWPWISPYSFCLNNPIKMIDPDGQSPIYDTSGNFLGTDDTGLQGYYYVMDKNNFTQGMSHWDVVNYAITGNISIETTEIINTHYNSLCDRPDYDGFVTIQEGIAWAKSHPSSLKNPSPNSTLYINAAQLDFGDLATSDFAQEGIITPQNLFNGSNAIRSIGNSKLMATIYALGRVNMVLINREQRMVKIINDDATIYDWNLGGNSSRNVCIILNNAIFNINPAIHGFQASYYGVGVLRK